MVSTAATHADDIIEKLYAAFERDEWINLHSHPIELKSKNGSLIMEGRVENVAAKRRAQVLAEELAGESLAIEDRLRREPSESQGDRELRDELLDRFSQEPLFLEYTLGAKTFDKVETFRDAGPGSHEIILQVDDGAVTLKGTVESLIHKRFAEILGWWSYACETVDNWLEVKPSERDSDEEITDAARMALEKDPMMDSGQFHVTTSGHIVELEGMATSDVEKKYAVMDVWSVPGVWDVRDRISVKSS